MRSIAFVATASLAIAGCGSMTGSGDDDEPSEPLSLSSISPDSGGVVGGTPVTLSGAGISKSTTVTIGGAPCTDLQVMDSHKATCTTGDVAFVQGAADVVATRNSDTVTLSGAFTYNCNYTTKSGKTLCGAAPPIAAPEQTVDTWVTQFQGDHGFTVGGPAGASSMADTEDHVLGDQSVFIQTTGAGGAVSTISRTGMPAMDLSDHMIKVVLRVDNVIHLGSIDVMLGDSNFANAYTFSLKSGQGQQYMTDGDWVSFSVSWDAANVSVRGTPNRRNITDVQFRVSDDAQGVPVKLHVNGLGLVKTPSDKFPHGVVTFTFDDDWATMVTPGSQILAQHDFPATAYVIVDKIGGTDRATLGELHDLDASGWDISSHAFTDVDHSAMFTTLAPNAVEDDMVNTRQWLIDNGFGGFDHCAYPSGEFDEIGQTDASSVAGRYFTSCRTIYGRQLESFPPSDPRKLRVFYASASATLASAIAAVDAAKANGDWLIIVNHRLVDVPTLNTDWHVADYQALVDHVAQSGIDVATMTQVLGNHLRPAANATTH